MKGVIIILDGIGDLPCKILNGKTPLEAAKTPNLDVLALRSKLGRFYSVDKDFVPGSDEAILSLFGNPNTKNIRGSLEAIGSGLNLEKGDFCFRINFGTIDSLKQGNIIDRRAGRNLSSNEAKNLIKEIKSNVKIDVEYEIISTVQHRGVIVFKGNLSPNINGNDSSYIKKHVDQNKICPVSSIDEDSNSIRSARIINDFIKKSHEVLSQSLINQERLKKGLLPANFIFLRGGSLYQDVKLNKYKKWMSIVSMPLEKGFSDSSGMKTFHLNYPELKGIDAYNNLWRGLKKMSKFSIKTLRKNFDKFDYAYIHIKETDLPGHDNKPIEKKLMIEYLDNTLFKFLAKTIQKNYFKLIITGDHSTPCKIKNHSADPVPVLIYDSSVPEIKRFNEISASKGVIGDLIGFDLLLKTGFVNKQK